MELDKRKMIIMQSSRDIRKQNMTSKRFYDPPLIFEKINKIHQMEREKIAPFLVMKVRRA